MSSKITVSSAGGNSMSEITKVALDAMGGDNAPVEIVKGAMDAISKRKDINFHRNQICINYYIICFIFLPLL